MRYLSIVYYDTFSRFFCAIEDAVKETNPNAEFMHLAIFPSGYLYMKKEGRSVKLLPWEILNSKHSESTRPIADIENLTKYHNHIKSKDKKNLQEILNHRATRYINFFETLLESYKPNVIIFSGDTRIACETLRFCLQNNNSKAICYYFEQGPNGTTIFDEQGVNANCSFRYEVGKLTGEGFPTEIELTANKYIRNPIYRGIDHLLIRTLKLFNKVPPEWDTLPLIKLKKHKYTQCTKRRDDTTSHPTKEILIALQVPDDANNVHHNPLALSDVSLLRLVLQATSSIDIPIRVREHPLYKKKYSHEMYDEIISSSNLFISKDSLSNDLSKASIVVTVNSMTGLDAYILGIPIIVLGNAFYDHIPNIERPRDISSLRNSINRALSNNRTPEKTSPAAIFNEMKSKYFIPGHYRDKNLTSPSVIAKILTRHDLNLN